MMLSHPMHSYASASHFQPLSSSAGDIDPGMSHHLAMPSAPTASKSSLQHPYNSPKATSRVPRSSLNGSGAPIRRRISRACDQCNQLRTKCDGKLPCQHCTDFSLKCEYARERKKRGKASRKDIAAAQAAAAAAAAAAQQNGGIPNGGAQQVDHMGMMNGSARRGSELPPPPRPDDPRKGSVVSAISSRSSIGSDLHELAHQQIHHQIPPPQQHHHAHHMHAPESPSLQLQHEPMPLSYDRMSPYAQPSAGALPPVTTAPNGYVHNEFMISPHHQAPPMGFPTAQISPVAGLMAAQSPEANPAWMELPSPPSHSFNNGGLRYPVLVPLLPHLTSILPPGIACDLLDLYFTNPSSTFFQPASPYVLTQIFRRQTFLHPTNPRPTSPSLLCAMLWVSAQTSDAPYLTATPTARGRVCQKLLELCISLLRPLVHINFATSQHSQEVENGTVGVGLAGLGSAQGATSSREGGVGAAGSLDDVLTYAHLGVVISASEFKAASLRWWQAAWTLAKELKLNLEVEHEMTNDHINQHARGQSPNGAPTRSPMSEEEKEERRRTWWLLYIVDRHLALCYNRPIALLDIECADLYLPYDDNVWQNGDFYGANDSTNLYAQSPPTGVPAHLSRHIGPTFEVSGSGLFQFFLPLMTILGEIVDLHHERNRPRFAVRGQENAPPAENDRFAPFVEEITAQLNAYQRSLEEFEQLAIQPHRSDQDGSSDRPQSSTSIQAKIAISYGTHVMHVLHILLAGKWDPISMLDDNDLWISSPAFLDCTGHAVSAAQAISQILEYDPDLSFMPYFFGIYLLQGSFLLLLIADKLQENADPEMIQACETIVRAHEVCVVTLNTEYQRNFRKVMRSALNQVRGRLLEDPEEQKQRRREVLQLYRWCGNGTGLAL